MAGWHAHTHGCLDAKGTSGGAAEILMRLWVKIKILVEPLDILISGRSWLGGCVLARDPPDVPGDACHAPAEPILLSAHNRPRSGASTQAICLYERA